MANSHPKTLETLNTLTSSIYFSAPR